MAGKTNLTKAAWLKLAKALIEDTARYDRVSETLRTAYENAGMTVESWIPDNAVNMRTAIEDVLGDAFSYWYYDCDQDFNEFNKNSQHLEGHLDCHSLDDLWWESKNVG